VKVKPAALSPLRFPSAFPHSTFDIGDALATRLNRKIPLAPENILAQAVA